jgi:penicillin-binding protein 1A
MTLGAFKQGVSVLDWAHAYEAFATGGKRVYGTLGAPDEGPVGIREVRLGGEDGKLLARNKRRTRRVLPYDVAAATTAQMQTVVSSGTGRRAAYGGFAAGKTGTTENFGDAWFVGFTRELTIAVWVGYPDATRPMKTEFGGEPVAGGTFPAVIWRDFALQAKTIFERRAEERAAKRGPTGQSGPTGESGPPSVLVDGQDAPAAEPDAEPDERDSGPTKKQKRSADEPADTPAPAEPQPEQQATPAPEPTPDAPPPADDGGDPGGGIAPPPG